jgi:hypothetical protein
VKLKFQLKEKFKKPTRDETLLFINSIIYTVLVYLIAYIIVKLEMEYLIPASWIHSDTMISISFIILLICAPLVGLSIIKPKFCIKRRDFIENVIFIPFSIVITMGFMLLLLTVVLQDFEIFKPFATKLMGISLLMILSSMMLLFPWYLLFEIALAHFAEDAEYFFSECYDTLSKIEPVYKNPDDISTFVYYYEKGFKKLNKKLGERLNLSSLKYEIDDSEALESIYKKLPYYLFLGENEQLERAKQHIKEIQNSLKLQHNELQGKLIFGEIRKFCNEINKYIKTTQILPRKRSSIRRSLTEYIQRHRKTMNAIILSIILSVVSVILNSLNFFTL